MLRRSLANYRDSSGNSRVVIYLHFWRWKWEVADIAVPMPVMGRPGFHPSKDQERPSPSESKAVADLLEHEGMKAVVRIWDAQQAAMEWGALNVINDHRFHQGIYKGFLTARMILPWIATYSDEAPEIEMSEQEADLFENMRKMDEKGYYN